jgi:hypothetical protein
MSLTKSKKLVDLLLAKTQKGGIDWQEGFPGFFQVSFRDNTVRLEWNEGRTEGSPVIMVFLLNGEGAIVDRFSDEDLDNDEGSAVGGQWFGKLKELYTSALRHARGADKVLNAILDELDDDIPL